MDRPDASVIHRVQGETENECYRKIQEVHSLNYQVVGKKDVKIKKGLFFHIDGVEISYMLCRPSYRTQTSLVNSINQGSRVNDFEKEREKILESVKYKPNPQMQEVLDTVKAMQEQMASSKNFAPEEHSTITRIETLLEENEFSASYTRRIVEKIRKNFPLDTLDDFDSVQNSVVEWICESVSIQKPVYESRPQIIVLVGPTGVGKTTTVAKLAARYAFGKSGEEVKKNVRIITIDWFRIGAKEQIEIYGDTMQVPVSKAQTADDINELINMYRNDEDYIIIDTTGYSPKDYENIAKMKKILDIGKYSVKTYLCMTASTKLSDMKDIMQQYEIFGYDSVIITKFDETSHIGNVVSGLSDKGKTLTYFTTGQKVPHYLEQASVNHLLERLSGFNFDSKSLGKKFDNFLD